MNPDPFKKMDKEAGRVASLIARYIRGTISEAEHTELDDWVNASDQNMELFEELTNEANLDANLAWLEQRQPPPRIRKRVWIAAAAMVLAIVGAAFLYYKRQTPKLPKQEEIALKKLEPGGNKATLKLADGTIIDLTTTKNGLVNTGKADSIHKINDGRLSYSGDFQAPDTVSLHTLSVPLGGMFEIILDDGTSVKLNSSSQLIYPAHFGNGDRKVQLIGEGYFDVKKDRVRPFIVSARDAEITVLGTKFNINSYDDEASLNTSLMEGSVRISSSAGTRTIRPGQQLQIKGAGMKIVELDIDRMARWRENYFSFYDAPIEEVMSQIARWYSAELVYQEKTHQRFNGSIRRSLPLANVLTLLEKTGGAHFRIENNKIIVMK